MQGYLFYSPRFRPTSSTGGVLRNATITAYLSETTTLSPIYYDLDLTKQLSNPLLADTTGLFPAFYLDPSIEYRIILKDNAGVVIFDQDPYVVPSSPFGTAVTTSSNNHITMALPATAGTTLTVAGSSSNDAIEITAQANQAAVLSLLQTGQTHWEIYQPPGSNDLRFNNGSDKLTLDQTGNLTVAGNLSVGSTSIIGQSVSKYKVSSQSVAANTVFGTDADLVFPAVVAGTYVVEGLLFPLNSTTTTQGFKFQLSTGTGGTSGKLTASGVINGAAFADLTSPVGYATILASYSFTNVSITSDYIRLYGIITTTATNDLSLQWAQNSSSSNLTLLTFGSFLSITKVA